MPKGSGPFPAVVLISALARMTRTKRLGQTSRSETSPGDWRPQGIATLRFRQAHRAAVARWTINHITLKEEYSMIGGRD